ncbi:MAG TPA: hypothetical protein VJM34_09030 [Novosphingobium sp.]|nr:hypothetical protein [Novosphingobium sp.]
MRGWGFLLLCLIMTSLATASIVHAGEIPGFASIECSGHVHTEDDSDQSPGEPDKAVQHHGGCHGAIAVAPARDVVSQSIALPRAMVMPRVATTPGHWNPGPGLRPPIA